MNRPTNGNPRGFTLLELVIGMSLFLIITGAILSSMSRLQATYRHAEVRTTMQQRVRAAMELMAQEIGQAGLQASTIEGASTAGTGGITPPYTLSNVTSTGASYTAATGSSTPYKGQWLVVDGGANQEAIQLTDFTGSTITANFGITHTGSIPAYPMGVFPHGILSEQSTIGRLAMFGEINGSGMGLWAVEYSCPASGTTGSLVRKQWDVNNIAGTGTSYNLIDNVTECYFCYPNSVDSRCPSGMATPHQVTLPSDQPAIAGICTGPGGLPVDQCTYPIITQVGFTVTVLENMVAVGATQSSTSGSTIPITITKSYSNIQPRNLITADNILTAAKLSSSNANGGDTSFYSIYLNGELQPDPPLVASVPW